MSHILEALQKLQDEKRGAATPDPITGGALITPRPERKKKIPGGRGVLLISVAAIIALSLAVWWYLKPASKSDKPIVAQTAPAPTVTAPPAPLPDTAVPATPLPVPPAETAAKAPDVKPAPAPAAVSNDEEEESSQPVRRSRTASAAAPASVPASAPVRTMAAPAEIKVEGIAWQEARSRRRAVINGLLVGEGALVNGATVKEIQQNRVLFLMNGATFEVSVPR